MAALKLNRQAYSAIPKCICLTLLVNGQELKAQTQTSEQFTRHYEVRYNGTAKGKMSVTKKIEGGITKLRIETDFNIQLLVPVSIKAIEEAAFSEGIMTYSSVDRKINGKQKMNQKLIARGETYEWSGKEKKGLPSYPVRHSVLSLYFQEPEGEVAVFSDAHRRNIPIKNVTNGRYRLDLPNGSFNFYTYSRGICTLIEVHHSLFQIQILLIR